jgi:Flp pilus assembly CpaE family ATPase
MYPLPVVLLGLSESELPSVRRELTNASADVETEFACVGTGIECLRHKKSQPKVLIVRVGGDGQSDAIQQLADNLAGWPILALVAGGTLDDFLRINRAGAFQIVPLPLDRDDFHQALGLIAAQFGKGNRDKHVFAVTGAAGGSGVTTIAMNLAIEIAERLRRQTILAELSDQMGALASLFDVEPRVTLPHLIREIHRVDDFMLEKALFPVMDGLRILAGSDVLRSLGTTDPAHLVKIVGCMKKLADVTILDMPGTFNDLEFQVLRCCDHVIVVGTQNVPSIRSLKLFCESLPEERVRHSLRVVINRYSPGVKGFGLADIERMLGIPNVTTIANDFQAVNLSINKGRPLRHVAPGTPILHDLEVLIRQLIDLDDDDSKINGRGVFGRMLHFLKR